MGKFKRNYADVDRREASEGYTGDVPKPGIYEADLIKCSEHTSAAGNEGTEWVFEIVEEPYTGWRGYVYTNEEGAAWKEAQVLEAIGLLGEGEDKIETTHEKIVAKAKRCRVKVRNETYEEEKRGKITTVLPAAEGKGKSSKKGKKKKDDEEPF